MMHQSWNSMAMNIISYGTTYSLSVLVRIHWTSVYTKRHVFIKAANLHYVAKKVF